MERYKYIYGPVLSRRLGRSLGVDIIPFKTCSYDCVYCLLGRTKTHTSKLAEYVPCDAVLEELERKLSEDKPDAISFAGSGEPTLNSALGNIIAGIKKMTDVPVVVFTNSSLLWKPEVRQNLALADIISPSMDAVVPQTLQKVNRPCEGLNCELFYQGIKSFCHEYRGRIWLEILLAAGMNDSDADVNALVGAARGLENLECIQLNTVVRPPAEKHVGAVSRERLEAIRRQLPGKVEIIASFFGDKEGGHGKKSVSAGEIADLVERHPSTLEGIAEGLDVGVDIIRPIVEKLVTDNVLAANECEGKTFYVVTNPS
ncbi:hypothetical protein B5F76_10495 [Desulfovibrio sp. An276]|uniref:radical SAM protein n=1 Tax=Desulfovibrio sp. An276 TaxID=1965618 RepID=UPI000B3936AB|nr:radical SAM protein [Desulfovibrio sp. An276]OUO51026.1 hypothetical protein B5F76_10495 [Desulfovibrio sp. An276]